MPQISSRLLNFTKVPISTINVKSKNQIVSQKNVKSNEKFNFCIFDYQSNFNQHINKISKTSNFNTNNGQTKSSSRKRNKDYLFNGKSVTRKLFEKAKIIQNPQRETYLSPQTHNLPTQLNNLQSKKSQYQGNYRLTKAKSEKNLLLNTHLSSKNINKQRNFKNCSKQLQNQVSLRVVQQKKAELKLNFDEQDFKNLVKNNLFTSQNGLQILQSLERNLQGISQVNKRESQQDKENIYNKLQKQKLSNKFFKVQKTQSIQVNGQQNFVVQEQEQKEIKNKDLNRQRYNFKGSISRLIMGSQFTRKTSGQVQLSQLSEQQLVRWDS